jgi:hypothetical protein
MYTGRAPTSNQGAAGGGSVRATPTCSASPPSGKVLKGQQLSMDLMRVYRVVGSLATFDLGSCGIWFSLSSNCSAMRSLTMHRRRTHAPVAL